MSYAWLALAIVCEVVATSCLKATEGFSRPVPSIIAVAGVAASFYFISLTMKVIPIGVSYAIWGGAGTILVALIGFVAYRQALDAAALTGMALIVAGVAIINLFSKSTAH
jgi:small multidrug resistance pump